MVGKNNGQAAQNKLVISKDKLCDEKFDQLVMETSRQVTRKRLVEASDLRPSEAATTAEVNHTTHSLNEDPNQRSRTDAAASGGEASNQINSLPPIAVNERSNQPKRPMNAFMVWGQAIRRELHNRFSNVQNALLSKALGRVWRSLDRADKEPYVEEANLIKANHKRDYPNYRYQPRRIQERRVKSSTLIGINLNHPVSQHPRQQQASVVDHFGMDNSIFARATHQSILDSHHQHQHQQQLYGLSSQSNRQQLGKQFQLDLAINIARSGLQPDAGQKLDRSKEMGSVQTFQYQPYPMTQADSQPPQEGSSQNRFSNNCRMGITSSSGYQEFHNHNNQQPQRQTICNANKQQEFAHSHTGEYHHLAYSAQHRHHHNQQPLPHQQQQYPQVHQALSYQTQQACLFETCCPPTTTTTTTTINSGNYYPSTMNDVGHIYKFNNARNSGN